MIRITGLKARFAVIALLVFAFVSFLFLGPYEVIPGHLSPKATAGRRLGHTSEAVLTGHAIAPKLGNATAKYVPGLHADFLQDTSTADHNFQGRTRARGMESTPHNIRSLPRKAYKGGERGATVICSSVPTLVPLVCHTPYGAHQLKSCVS
jgi:hypothetical protein